MGFFFHVVYKKKEKQLYGANLSLLLTSPEILFKDIVMSAMRGFNNK